MSNVCLDKIRRVIEKDNLTLNELYAIYCVNDTISLIDVLKEEINGEFETLLQDKEFFKIYHLFFYRIMEVIDRNPDSLIAFKQYLDCSVKDIRGYLKVYTKEGKKKDGFYHMLNSIVIEKLVSASRYVASYIEDVNENEDFKIMWFMITDLKKMDYLFRIIELHPEYINCKNKNGVHIFKYLIEYIFANLRFWDNDIIKYFKRVFVFFLESDNLLINNEDLFQILEMIELNLQSNLPAVRNHIKFFLTEINNHYSVVNKDSRVNAPSFVLKECPIDIIIPSLDGRVDLRDLFTISIDTVRKEKLKSHLIDDAYSIRDFKDGSCELYIHIPDVGETILIDSETDKYMRSLGESVYAHGMKTPLINYQVARDLSLYQGKVRPALTFIIRIDANGKVLGIDFKKTLINVNYNLSKRQAEIFARYNNDPRLFMINRLYEIALELRRQRKESIGKRGKIDIIIDEMNIWPDILTAEYCQANGIVFPYKNYFGKRTVRSVEYAGICETFARRQQLSSDAKELLYSVFDINNRVYYDTTFVANRSSHNRPIGNVGNPLREYISLETDRMIKDVIIDGIKNAEYWAERLERDCIEFTETSAKIKQLYYPKS